MVEHGLNLKCYGMNLQLIVLKGLKQWIKIFPTEIKGRIADLTVLIAIPGGRRARADYENAEK